MDWEKLATNNHFFAGRTMDTKSCPWPIILSCTLLSQLSCHYLPLPSGFWSASIEVESVTSDVTIWMNN
jgi:hypothetical protein